MSSVNNYPADYIKELQKQVQKVLAKTINKENSSRKSDLGFKIKKEQYLKLASYNSILNYLLNCSTCDLGYEVDEIVSLVKNNINALS